MTWQSGWHFIDQPYYDQGGSEKDFPGFVPATETIDMALDALTRYLKGDKSSESSTYVKIIKKNFSVEEEAKSFALRLVIHYVGDIHQPLHTTSVVDHTYPKGDRGGNDEKLPDQHGAGVDNLHAMWDSVIYDFPGYVTLVSDMHWY